MEGAEGREVAEVDGEGAEDDGDAASPGGPACSEPSRMSSPARTFGAAPRFPAASMRRASNPCTAIMLANSGTSPGQVLL